MSVRYRKVQEKVDHRDWLTLLDSDGPCLSVPVLNEIWPTGLPRLDSSIAEVQRLQTSFQNWQKKQSSEHEKWLYSVLVDGALWGENLVTGTAVPERLSVQVPEHGTEITHWGALFAPGADKAVAKPLALVHSLPGVNLRALSPNAWSASAIDRMAIALRRLNVPIGLVTNGRHWAIVWAENSVSTGSTIFDSLLWNEEKLLRDAFFALIGIQRFIGVAEEERLPKLFGRSLLQQEEITDELGRQIRQAVELIVQSFSESRIELLARNAPDPLPAKEREPYEAAVTIMMRIVFLLFAEERNLLPVDSELFNSSYALSTLLDSLEDRALHNDEILDSSTEAWHRILSTSEAIFYGTAFEDMRMPSYGGSLFDPARFPWLTAVDNQNGLMLHISDRIVLHVLRSIQVVNHSGQARRISFREVDVEQIGYIYEGLLGYTSKFTNSAVILGLKGTIGDEPEIDLDTLVELRSLNQSDDEFVDKLLAHLSEVQPGSKPPSKNSLIKSLKSDVVQNIARAKLGAVTAHNQHIIERILPFYNLLRFDLRGLPYVVAINGLYVTETRSRKNAGAHYTPKSLAEEVVLHTLEPLVYFPGPLQSENPEDWKLKNSAEILDLKIVDIAVGSGAFLVAAARYLSERLIEAWKLEGLAMLPEGDSDLDETLDRLSILARREVIARCLYGADINELAVEMCKLSLWLVSLDPKKSFSFLDDKIFLGNSLLGLTNLEQLEYLHISPSESLKKAPKLLFSLDVSGPIQEAIALRQEISNSPVDDKDPHRSTSHKKALLNKADEVTQHLKEVADGVIAAGLIHGGKPGTKLEQAFQAFPHIAYQAFGDVLIRDRTDFDRIVEKGLTPTVETDYERWQPLHWILEVPDVMERGGFDAIIGNPPFLGRGGLTSAVGENLRSWFSNIVASKTGACDLIGFFFLRAAQLTKKFGNVGLIGSSSIGEGITAQVALKQILADGWEIYRAFKYRDWPTSSASLRISIVWLSRGDFFVPAIADGVRVEKISYELLDDAQSLEDIGVLQRKKVIHQGSILRGKGFVLSDLEAKKMIKTDNRNSRVIRKFLNGRDVNGTVARWAGEWCINFDTRTKNDAENYTDPFKHVERFVKPERDKLSLGIRSRERWWIYESPRSELYEDISELPSVIVMSRLSKHLVPAIVKNEFVYSDLLHVWTSEDTALFAILTSWPHRLWAMRHATTRGEGFRYTIRDCWTTFPLPRRTDGLRELGVQLKQIQDEICLRENLTLTELYNSFNDKKATLLNIDSLRSLHVDVDHAVTNCYGFDLPMPQYDFRKSGSGVIYCPSEDYNLNLLQMIGNENINQKKQGVVEWM